MSVKVGTARAVAGVKAISSQVRACLKCEARLGNRASLGSFEPVLYLARKESDEERRTQRSPEKFLLTSGRAGE
jgi:hypothetical protein